MSNHLFDAIRRAARPDSAFILTADGRVWTYGDMLEDSGRIASVLDALGCARAIGWRCRWRRAPRR